MIEPTLLVVAKAPVPGLAKTRIAADVGDDLAARLAAAALLDTLAVATASGLPVVVALTGDLDAAAESAALRRALAPHRVVGQRGDGLAARLAAAHADAASDGAVVQIGMDTPQITVDDLSEAARRVRGGRRVLGPAADGGWWLLGLPDAREATRLLGVAMSSAETGRRTADVFGGEIDELRVLRDMDTWADATTIAADLAQSRLAATMSEAREGTRS